MSEHEYHEYGYYLSPGGVPSWVPARVTAQGERVMIDWLTQKLLKGEGYHIRAGTVATGVAMDSTVTDTDAEMCIDAASGLTIVPVQFNIAFDEIATATTVRVAVKAVGTASNAGAVFTPIPLLQGGAGGSATARVEATGAVQVVGEVATQSTPLTATRRLWQYNAVYTETPATDTGGYAGPLATLGAGMADLRYIGKGVACVYVQAAATTAFPLYFASLDFVEFDSDELP